MVLHSAHYRVPIALRIGNFEVNPVDSGIARRQTKDAVAPLEQSVPSLVISHHRHGPCCGRRWLSDRWGSHPLEERSDVKKASF
ncbi:hypothetical protein M2222_008329 [Bradyrhizobium elkanii]|nr:hypothetical protein [Bradyrhizobium elkanii]MCS3566007.1 hypothetical protein [Bradyrhizobium elkanii]MCW2153263.1 hypothetical protein [Bradyrhizobium elkanii]MCW2356995.1 hypothetical protein [Bradyrhizobium elkanii]MCW2376996.1 hypothetical protein [Bradyrhizobium elkanii]